MMRASAEKMRTNVGLETADRDEMVYLESVRYNREVTLRNVVAGHRVPIVSDGIDPLLNAGEEAVLMCTRLGLT